MNDRVKYAYIIRELEEISVVLGKLGDSIFEDDKDLCKMFYKIISDIMFDLTGPIVKKYPSLRPPVLLDEMSELSRRYNIMWHDDITDTDSVICHNVAATLADDVIQKLSRQSGFGDKGFFYMELI